MNHGFKKGNKRGRGRGSALRRESQIDPGYTDDELEFMLACEVFVRERGVLRPSDVDLLAIARSLGWRKDSA
jgi:hypothetical protein